jgi:deoxyadenosine/deoxycytidine kinase
MSLAASKPRIFSIEGNIGSGKSTLVSMLKNAMKDDTEVVFMQEPVDIWQTIQDKNGETILSKFYADQDKYAFSFQMMAYISRISMLKKLVKDNPDKIIICERSVLTDKNVFAKMLYDAGNIEEVNYQIYLKWFDEFIADVPIAGLIYVKADPQVSHERVQKRAREGENIPLEYLKNCHTYHNDWIESETCDVLTLDANTDKEETNDAYAQWIHQIDEFVIDTALALDKKDGILVH